MIFESLYTVCGILVVASPLVLLAVLGLSPLVYRSLSEAATAKWTASCVLVGLAANVIILIMMLIDGTRFHPIQLGEWVSLPREHFHFTFKFVFDRLSVPFSCLTFVLVGAIGQFGNRYLHREPGYGRFFLSFTVFLLGMVWASLAGTIETLFVGWEFVGLSSAMLVAYFNERAAPVNNALRIWSIYRISDAAFLVAALVLHHVSGGGEFSELIGHGYWPMGEANLTSGQALLIGLLLLFAAAGKSALVPFSGWLPRAMEGPTPSSAVFYGALSVHLGAFLLLRVSPILELSFFLSLAVIVLGLGSAIFASMASRVQTDVKSALAYASLTQVGIITAEIGVASRFGGTWYYIPLIHSIGHAFLRTLQLLRAPSLLNDYSELENALGGHLHHPGGLMGRLLGMKGLHALYRAGFMRGELDSMLDRYIVNPFTHRFRVFDRLERRWTNYLAGVESRESDRVTSAPPTLKEN